MYVDNRQSAWTLVLCSTLIVVACLGPGEARGDAADTMYLTDEPGKWFCSEATGTPLAVINAGERVDFKINNCCTNTRHTVTLLIKPVASGITICPVRR